MSRMELGITEKFHQIESTMDKLMEAFMSNIEGSRSSNTNDRTVNFA